MKKQKNIFKVNEQDKTSEKAFDRMKISGLLDKELKIMVIKMLTKLGRRMDKHSKNSNKEIENRRKYQVEVTELGNTIIVLKNRVKSFTSRPEKAEERIGNRIVEGQL